MQKQSMKKKENKTESGGGKEGEGEGEGEGDCLRTNYLKKGDNTTSGIQEGQVEEKDKWNSEIKGAAHSLQ